MKEHRMRSKAICILGMHRSGTSTITRAVNFLGAYLGEEHELHPAGFDNPEGFWERKDVIDLHERMLVTLKRAYDTVLPLPEGWHLSQEITPFREELRNLITNNFSSRLLWAWKDPRTCLFLDLWKEVLDELQIELVCIFVVRNPLDVANSLLKRNELDIAKSLGFWFNHNISALQAASDLPNVFVSYDTFLEQWDVELKRCALATGIPWPVDAGQLKGSMSSFIKPGLRHSKSTVNDLATMPPPVLEIYEMLLDLASRPGLAVAPVQQIERLWMEFQSYASFFGPDMENLFVRERVLADWSDSLSRQETQLQQNLESQSSEKIAAGEMLKILRQQMSTQGQDLDDYRGKLSQTERLLEMREKAIEELINSYSWKITTPLRWLWSKTIR